MMMMTMIMMTMIMMSMLMMTMILMTIRRIWKLKVAGKEGEGWLYKRSCKTYSFISKEKSTDFVFLQTPPIPLFSPIIYNFVNQSWISWAEQTSCPRFLKPVTSSQKKLLKTLNPPTLSTSQTTRSLKMLKNKTKWEFWKRRRSCILWILDVSVVKYDFLP